MEGHYAQDRAWREGQLSARGKAVGLVSITPTRLWLLFVDPTRKAPAKPTLTDDEAVAAMKLHVGWTGKYTTADQTPDGLKMTALVDTAWSQRPTSP
jgi:hypothetical protein